MAVGRTVGGLGDSVFLAADIFDQPGSRHGLSDDFTYSVSQRRAGFELKKRNIIMHRLYHHSVLTHELVKKLGHLG